MRRSSEHPIASHAVSPRSEASQPNAVWQADHTPLDLWVRDERGRPARPWLTVILDDYSRAVAGYSLSVHAPSALQTALALRQAIWHKGEARWPVCGIPTVLYTDHGSDFTSRHLEQVAADLTMRLVFSKKGAPRGRGKIERFFGTVHQLCISELPGYTPPGTLMSTPTLTMGEVDARLHAFYTIIGRIARRAWRRAAAGRQGCAGYRRYPRLFFDRMTTVARTRGQVNPQEPLQRRRWSVARDGAW